MQAIWKGFLYIVFILFCILHFCILFQIPYVPSYQFLMVFELVHLDFLGRKSCCCCPVAKSYLTLQPPGLQHARRSFLPFTISLSLLKLISFESMMPSIHLILCHPLLLLTVNNSSFLFPLSLFIHPFPFCGLLYTSNCKCNVQQYY